MYNVNRYYYLRSLLLTKIEYFTSEGYNFSHIAKMNITFITNYNNMTFKYYLTQPKSMLAWKIVETLARNHNLMQVIIIPIYYLLNHHNFNFDGEDQDRE